MAYTKFDAKLVKTDDSRFLVNDAFRKESMRRALQGIANRILTGTGGTDGTNAIGAVCATGTTAGVKTTSPVSAIVNGKRVAIAAGDNVELPTATLAASTVAKFLISANADGTVSVTGPGNVVEVADYASAGAAGSATYLPDLPDDSVALGYFLWTGPAVAVTMGTGQVLDTATTGTAAYTDLFCMPYNG